jgi:cytochrome c biogenesis protein CcdA
VLGFSIVFVAYGAALGGLGHLLTGHARLLTRILGVLTIALGLLEVTGTWSTFMAWLQVHWAGTYQAPL